VDPNLRDTDFKSEIYFLSFVNSLYNNTSFWYFKILGLRRAFRGINSEFPNSDLGIEISNS